MARGGRERRTATLVKSRQPKGLAWNNWDFSFAETIWVEVSDQLGLSHVFRRNIGQSSHSELFLAHERRRELRRSPILGWMLKRTSSLCFPVPYPVGIDSFTTSTAANTWLSQQLESIDDRDDQGDQIEDTGENSDVIGITVVFFINSTDGDMVEAIFYHVGEGGKGQHTAETD